MKQQKTNNWQIKKLGEVCRITYGKGLPTKKLKESGFPVFGANGIIGFNDTYLYKEPQVLISCRGAYSGKINFSPPFCFVTNNSLILEINSNEDLDKRFLYYILHTVNKSKLVTGTAQPQVTINNAVELTFNLPPLETQQAIVSKIEELFSELDKGIAELKTAQQQLKTYRQSVLKSAFEGKLTNENVKDGELPDGWEIIKVIDVALKVTDGEHSTPRRTDNGYFLLSARNIQNGFLALDNVDYIPEDEYNRIIKRCNPEEGDILISCSGSVGRICRVPKNIEFGMVRSVALLKLDWEKFSSKYFEFLFQSPYLQKQIEKGKKATAQANLFLGPIKNLDLIIPSLKEQHRIVQEIESRLSVADKMEQSIQESLQKAEALRQSILKKAFCGELV